MSHNIRLGGHMGDGTVIAHGWYRDEPSDDFYIITVLVLLDEAARVPNERNYEVWNLIISRETDEVTTKDVMVYGPNIVPMAESYNEIAGVW